MILDYSFSKKTLSNPDGTLKAIVKNARIETGPGATPIGNFAKAYRFDENTKVKTKVESSRFNLRQFCISCAFNVTAPVSGKQILLGSDVFPVSIYVDKGSSKDVFNIKAALNSRIAGWIDADTFDRKKFKTNKWYTIQIAFDFDTLVITCDGKTICVLGLPEGALNDKPSGFLYFGTAADEKNNRFNGLIAGVQIQGAIPGTIENLLDIARTQPEWFFTYKFLKIKDRIDIGAGPKVDDFFYDKDLDVFFQRHQGALLSYYMGDGEAFELHGSILQYYLSDGIKSALGRPVSNEVTTAQEGGRKNQFEKGAIYWSPQTGAVDVLNSIYIEYERLGESAHLLGFPIKREEKITVTNEQTLRILGTIQHFESGRIFIETGRYKMAHAIYGPVFEKYIQTGGLDRWGFPQDHITDLTDRGKLLGKHAKFKNGNIFWAPRTGAHVVYGGILETYLDRAGGPSGEFGLGLPTSDEEQMPDMPDGTFRFNTFERGSILWFDGEPVICKAFNIRLDRLITIEDEGFMQGQNDTYFNVIIEKNKEKIFEKHFGEVGNANIRDINFFINDIEIIPNVISDVYTLKCRVMEEDPSPNSDDFLGETSFVMDFKNGWGVRNGFFHAVQDRKVEALEFSIHQKFDVNDVDFWSIINEEGNPATTSLSYEQYATGYDVDSEPEPWDFTDWIEMFFYEALIKNMSDGGACFGFSLEAMNAHKGKSRIPRPLQNHIWSDPIAREIRIQHSKQAGALPVYWEMTRFINLLSDDAVDTFQATREFGKSKVPCIVEMLKRSSGHAVYAIDWDNTQKPWRLKIFDPNEGAEAKFITIDPDNNTFEYGGFSSASGYRLTFKPYSLVSEQQKLPFWNLLALMSSGIIIFSNDAVTVDGIFNESGFPVDDGSLSVGGINPASRFFPVQFANGIGQNNGPQIWIAGKQPWSDGSILSSHPRLPAIPPKEYFKQRLRGVQNGEFVHSIHNGLSSFLFKSDTQTGEEHFLEAKGLGTHFSTFHLHAEKSKRYELHYSHELGLKGDRISCAIHGIGVNGDRPTALNIRPGVSGFDLVGPGGSELTLQVKAIIDGRRVERTFKVGIRGNGVRLHLSPMLHAANIKASQIDNLSGNGFNTLFIPAQ